MIQIFQFLSENRKPNPRLAFNLPLNTDNLLRLELPMLYPYKLTRNTCKK